MKKMKKNLLTLVALCAAALSLAAREVHFKGGYIETVDDYQVESFGDDMNFMFAYRFSDGSIHLGHSKGIHTVTEYGCHDISLDNGRTWKNNVKQSLGINTFEGKDGGKYQIGCWDGKKTDVHTVTLTQYDDATQTTKEVASCQIKLPFKAAFHIHRDVIRLKSGKLLANAYGAIEGSNKFSSYAIESDDDGRTWNFLSTIATYPENKPGEGFNESCMFQLKDGRICALCRPDGMGYVNQCFSSDEGKTWTEPQELTYFKGSAAPTGRVLTDGTIVILSGRPNLYLLVDTTGTGAEYQKVDIYRGSGSSYASILETAPNEILIIHDESNFGSWTSPTLFSRIHASRFRINRSEEAHVDDPLAAKYDYFFRPTTMERITKLADPIRFDYKPKSQFPDSPATMDVVEIPERPHPVLRLISHGVEAIDKFPTIRANTGTHALFGSKEVTVATEFRLGDQGEKGYQLQMVSIVGAADDENKGYLAYVRFAVDKIKVCGKSEMIIPYDIGTGKFHAFVLVSSAETKKASLYAEGQETPIVTFDMIDAESAPGIAIGDGSSDVFGSADISYLGWTIK